jgi:hypothetical protein
MKVRIIEANGIQKKEAIFDTEFITEFLKNNSIHTTASPNYTTIGPGLYGNSTTAGSIGTIDFSTETTSAGNNITYTNSSSFSTFINDGLAKIYLSTS